MLTSLNDVFSCPHWHMKPKGVPAFAETESVLALCLNISLVTLCESCVETEKQCNNAHVPGDCSPFPVGC